MQAVIDANADEAQRRALATVLHGGETQEAKTHWWVFHAMSTTVHKPIFVPIQFGVDIDARTAQVSIPGVLTSSGSQTPLLGRDVSGAADDAKQGHTTSQLQFSK